MWTSNRGLTSGQNVWPVLKSITLTSNGAKRGACFDTLGVDPSPGSRISKSCGTNPLPNALNARKFGRK